MSKRTVEDAFDEAAPDYDSWIRRALPTYEELFRVAIEAVPHARDAPIRVADLGAGSGLYSERVLQAFSRASVVLYDSSAEMLERAHKRFSSLQRDVTFVEERMEAFSEPQMFDLVVSSLAIHHLEHAEKRMLFRQVFSALRPEGAFVNVDQVRGEGRFRELYWSTWLSRVRASGAPESQIQSSIKRRREFDRDASLGEQLAWLADAGFEVDCIYKHYFMAIFMGVKP